MKSDTQNVIAYLISMGFLALFLYSGNVDYAVMTIIFTIYSAEASIRTTIEKGR